MFNVLIADDQQLVRTGFELILNSEPDINVIASVDNGRAALTAAHQQHIDVALLDIRMPLVDGLKAAAQMPDSTACVMVTTFNDPEYIDTALEEGAHGFLLKDSGPNLLIEAVRSAYAGDMLIAPEVVKALLERRRATERRQLDLTPREEEIARQVASGRTNQEIADTLFLSLSTIKTHLANIQLKLAARNRVEIAACMWAAGYMNNS